MGLGMIRSIFRWIVIALVTGLALIGVLAQTTTQPETLFQLELLNISNDQIIIADRLLGVGNRPEGWSDNDDLASESLLADLFINNELLADETFGAGVRPGDWIGATTRNADLIARNIRHDLEVLGNELLGVGIRPDEWAGGSNPIFTCSRTVMNTAFILDVEYNLRPTTPEGVRDYCFTVTNEIIDDLIAQAIGQPEIEVNTLQLLLAVRGDLERTADEVFGVNQRPLGWLDNTDINSPGFITSIASDLELLADEQLGAGVRPEGWRADGASGSELQALQILRLNVELITDELIGTDTRPRGWQGSEEPLLRCDPVLQNLLILADETYEDYEIPEVDGTNPNFCQVLTDDVNSRIENPPAPDPELELTPADQQFRGSSEFAFSYLDSAALEYMGVMPSGIEFRAWYRNFGESSMMFVSGENFAVFIDRRWTTLPQETFERLPTLDGVRPLTFCDAGWCNGPSPTPTPTGRGPLLDIIAVATPPTTATPEFGSEFEQGEVLVNWEAIRINYLLQRPEAGVAQVTLEICRDASQVACQAVISVTNAAGEQLPVLSQFNGFNVYELPYGYNTGFEIRGERFFSNDIWLLDPSALGG